MSRYRRIVPRFAAIRFHDGWGVWDNLRGRMSDGKYPEPESAAHVAAYFNANPSFGDRDWYGEGSNLESQVALPDDTRDENDSDA